MRKHLKIPEDQTLCSTWNSLIIPHPFEDMFTLDKEKLKMGKKKVKMENEKQKLNQKPKRKNEKKG